MSFCGKLLRVEDAPNGADKMGTAYPRWRMTVMDRFGKEQSASTGRRDIIDRARQWIGKDVTVFRGGKEGIVGGIREGIEKFP